MMLRKYHIPADESFVRQIGLLAISTLTIQEVVRETISRYKENIQTNKQARIWVYKDVHSTEAMQKLKLVLPTSYIDHVCTGIIYNKVPEGLIDIGIRYNNINNMLEIPLLGNLQLFSPFILEPNTEVTKVLIVLEKLPQGDTIHFVPIIHPIWCIPHMDNLDIPLVGIPTRKVRLNILKQMTKGYTVSRDLLTQGMKLTEVYKCIPNITPSGKYGVRLARSDRYIDEYMLPIHGVNQKTTTCIYLRTDDPLHFKRPITETQLLTLHSYKYNYYLQYNKNRSEYTLVCKKNNKPTPLEDTE